MISVKSASKSDAARSSLVFILNAVRPAAVLGLAGGCVFAVWRLLGGSPAGAVAASALIVAGLAFFSPALILYLCRARPVPPEAAPEIDGILSSLAEKAGMKPPRLWVMPSAAANALSAGLWNGGHIALTRGLAEQLNAEEMQGVLARELVRIRRGDSFAAGLAAAAASAAFLVTAVLQLVFFVGGGRDARDKNPLVLVMAWLLFPAAALAVLIFAGRRGHEHADAAGACLCGEPLYLASALKKMEGCGEMPVLPSLAPLFTVHPANAGFPGRLFLTHPPSGKRLQKLAGTAAGK